MPAPRITVVIPTLSAGSLLLDCVSSLRDQTWRDFEIVIVDNSGKNLVRHTEAAHYARVIENAENAGFGAAINQAVRATGSPYVATLNDDAIADPHWLEELLKAIESRSEAGMCASQILLAGTGNLDSAGMLIAPDGSSKQRGHLEPPEHFSTTGEVLLPSGCAALYRRAMLQQIGLFDEDFFLYCEDTDLGLRARWAGWTCLYVPAARVQHRYSQTAGRASVLKAYYVERNRLFLLAKNFPVRMLLRAPAATALRYFWQFASALQGKGTAGAFRQQGGSFLSLGYILLRAHFVLLVRLRRLYGKRRAIRRSARISEIEFTRLLAAYSISPKQVAEL